MGGPAPYDTALDQFRMVFNDPKWDWKTFDVDRDLAKAEESLKGLLTAIDPASVNPFIARGGKLLMYQDWSVLKIAMFDIVYIYIRSKSATITDIASRTR